MSPPIFAVIVIGLMILSVVLAVMKDKHDNLEENDWKRDEGAPKEFHMGWQLYGCVYEFAIVFLILFLFFVLIS